MRGTPPSGGGPQRARCPHLPRRVLRPRRRRATTRALPASPLLGDAARRDATAGAPAAANAHRPGRLGRLGRVALRREAGLAHPPAPVTVTSGAPGPVGGRRTGRAPGSPPARGRAAPSGAPAGCRPAGGRRAVGPAGHGVRGLRVRGGGRGRPPAPTARHRRRGRAPVRGRGRAVAARAATSAYRTPCLPGLRSGRVRGRGPCASRRPGPPRAPLRVPCTRGRCSADSTTPIPARPEVDGLLAPNSSPDRAARAGGRRRPGRAHRRRDTGSACGPYGRGTPRQRTIAGRQDADAAAGRPPAAGRRLEPR
jgi:hypothetical protein